MAVVAGSALQPPAVVLLEAANLEELAASKPEDWQVVEPSTTTEVGRALRALPLLALLLRGSCLLPCPPPHASYVRLP